MEKNFVISNVNANLVSISEKEIDVLICKDLATPVCNSPTIETTNYYGLGNHFSWNQIVEIAKSEVSGKYQEEAMHIISW